MAVIILFPLQNLKCLKIRYKRIKQPPEEVVGCLTCLCWSRTYESVHLKWGIAQLKMS